MSDPNQRSHLRFSSPPKHQQHSLNSIQPSYQSSPTVQFSQGSTPNGDVGNRMQEQDLSAGGSHNIRMSNLSASPARNSSVPHPPPHIAPISPPPFPSRRSNLSGLLNDDDGDSSEIEKNLATRNSSIEVGGHSRAHSEELDATQSGSSSSRRIVKIYELPVNRDEGVDEVEGDDDVQMRDAEAEHELVNQEEADEDETEDEDDNDGSEGQGDDNDVEVGEPEENEDENENSAEEEEEEEEDDDEEDDNGSVDLGDDDDDTPVFISSRGPLKIGELLAPEVVVKEEPASQPSGTDENRMDIDTDAARNQNGEEKAALTLGENTETGSGETNGTTVTTDLPNTPSQPIPPPPAQTEDGQPINTLQPKKKRAPKRSPSPDDRPPAPLIEMQTIRISIDLSAANRVKNVPKIFSFKETAIEDKVVEKDYWEALSGIPKPAPLLEGDQGVEIGKAAPGPGPGSSLKALMDAVGDGGLGEQAEAERLAAAFDKRYEEPGATKKKKRKVKDSDAYDINDPFVDDSELLVDEPMFYHQPKKAGFYVASGPIELCGELEPVPKKSRKTKQNDGTTATTEVKKKKKTKTVFGMGVKPGTVAAAGALARKLSPKVAIANGSGTDTPTPAEDPEVQFVGALKGPASNTERIAHIPISYQSPELALTCVPQELHLYLWHIKHVNDEFQGWAEKKSFPTCLVEPVKRFGHVAIELRAIDEPLFDAVPSFINYNRFTMKRWILRQCKDHLPVAIHAKEALIFTEIKAEVDVLAPRHLEEYEKQLTEHEEAKLRYHAETVLNMETADLQEITVPPPSPPAKKWKWNSKMKGLFAEAISNVEYEVHYLALLSDAMASRETVPIPTGQSVRTRLYARIVPLFPDGWMNTAALSREMSQLKTKKKQQV